MIRIYVACVFICLVSLFHTRKDTFGFDTFFLLELDFKTKQFIVGTIKPDQGTPTMTPFPVQITDWQKLYSCLDTRPQNRTLLR